jgi:hypothetical protein
MGFSESFCPLGQKGPYFEKKTIPNHDDFNTVDYKNVKNIYSRFRKTISGSFTGLFNVCAFAYK